MSISVVHEIKPIDETQFHKIDYQVTGLAFTIYNEFGRLWNETIYKNELANRCQRSGFKNVETEVEIRVFHEAFCKKYFIDLLVDNSVIYELKAVNKLTSEHERQTLTYLFLCQLQHAKLINFRAGSVKYRFVSTSIQCKDRYYFVIDDRKWINLDEDCIWLKELIIALLNDWGVYLEMNLFYEAIYYFRGGKEKVVQNLDIVHNSSILGKQKLNLLNSDIAFKITAFTRELESYEKHLCRFVNISNLKAMQWINFNRDVITFKTII